jgi:hypothetical protein
MKDMESTESLQHISLPKNLKSMRFSEVKDTWLEPHWWDVQETQFVSDAENERLSKELKDYLNRSDAQNNSSLAVNPKLA